MSTFVRACLVCISVCFGVLACGSQSFAQVLPAPWVGTDIGAPPAAGTASESGGTFSVRGAGTDIWYSTDQFHFVYQPITGDADIRAQVAGVEYVHAWTKAGVMIRASLDARASHASTFATPAKGLVFQRRAFTGGASTSTSGALATAPYWVRIVRSGELFTSYISPDGSSWMLVGSETIAMPATAYVGLAVVSKDPNRTALATFASVSVGASSSTEPPPPPPAPPPAPDPSAWVNGDIGNPALAGRASESGGTFSVTGAGSDIWNSADQFHFMYRPVDGDVEIVARVVDVEYANAWSKAGVMIRQDLTASSAHALMVGTPAKGWAFQRRPVAAGVSVHSPGSFTTPPGWVRLVRSGNTFSGYESTDGATWTLVGTETIDMAAGVYVGLAVTSHNTTMTSTATFTNVAVTTTSATNQPPTVTLTTPAPGTTYTAPATIALGATATDGDGTVAQVEFFANGQSIGIDAAAPYQATWSNVAEGSYNLTAVATDDGGATTTSSAASVTVGAAPANEPPAVSMTSPANGATYTAPATITITANATDSDGTVSRVDFFRGTQLIASDPTAPYSATWSGAPAGTYALTAVAVDDDGASTTSAAVTVTVSAPANQPPTVAITSPANGATYTAPATMTITATASDADGTVARVDFFRGTQLIASDTTAPYGATWSGAPAGTYALTAVAVDDDGATTTSAAVNVTVNAPPVNQPPTVAITSPANGATFTAPATIAITANATDTDGTIARLDFFRGTQLIASDTTAPYSATWSGAPAGTYALTAVAVDDDGASTTSAAVTVTVSAPPNQPPTVAITSPANGATYTAPATIAITANATDSDGTVAAVDFFANGQAIGTDTAAPFSTSWGSVPSGNYSITAVARDDDGATTTSAAVAITVGTPPPPTPTSVAFNPSADHDTLVTSYVVAIYRASDPVTAAPVATKDLGKPLPSNGDIVVDISDIVNPLAAGSYYAVVSAAGSGGSSASTPSANFTK